MVRDTDNNVTFQKNIKYFAFRNGYFVNYTIIFCSGGNWPSGYDKRLDDQDVVSLK